jgi:bifunctional N-acetylglucosamine-1-phosphate-uridyltransferase/glucosamine-1-phosphate-acetyltransferase GlmU-like protein
MTINSVLPQVNVLILAAGKGRRQGEDLTYPTSLAEVDGSSVLERILSKVSTIPNSKISVIFSKSEAQQYHLVQIASILLPGIQSFLVPEQTQGSACTALFAACQLDDAAELLIVSANEIVKVNYLDLLKNFRSRNLEAGTLTFRSVHPRYSYVAINEEGFVVETAQREPISSNATAGVFWFLKTLDFVEAAKNMIRKNAHIEGYYYVAPTFNELVLRQMRIGVVPLNSGDYTPLKTERQVQSYEGT